MKNLSTWLLVAAAGLLSVLILNMSPLARMGLNIELPIGWQNAPAKSYNDASCPLARREGIPFALNRQHKDTTCLSDNNRLALLFNAVTGVAVALLSALIGEKRSTAQATS